MFRKSVAIAGLILASATSPGCVTWLGAIAVEKGGTKAQATYVNIDPGPKRKDGTVDWLVLTDDWRKVGVACFQKYVSGNKADYVDLAECSSDVEVNQYLPNHIRCKVRKECLGETADMQYGYAVFVDGKKVLDPEIRIKGDSKPGAKASACKVLTGNEIPARCTK